MYNVDISSPSVEVLLSVFSHIPGILLENSVDDVGIRNIGVDSDATGELKIVDIIKRYSGRSCGIVSRASLTTSRLQCLIYEDDEQYFVTEFIGDQSLKICTGPCAGDVENDDTTELAGDQLL